VYVDMRWRNKAKKTIQSYICDGDNVGAWWCDDKAWKTNRMDLRVDGQGLCAKKGCYKGDMS